jgi:protein-L-isoaspartate O-methyltransferase
MTDASMRRGLTVLTAGMPVVTLALAIAMTSAGSAAQQPSASPAPTPDIHYVPTSNGVADAMLKLAHVTAEDTVYDLGSGDGRIVILAAKKYGARGVGVELDGELIKEARKNATKAGVSDKVTFVQGDLFRTDLSNATVVTLYLSNSINMRLRSLLQQQLKPGSRVVSHRFEMGDWKPDATVHLEGTSVHLWTIR